MNPRRLALTAALLLTVAAPGWAVTVIQLHAESPVLVDAGVVTLGDIAYITSDNADAEKRLRDLRITQAPSPGQERLLDAELVRIAVRSAGYDPDYVGLRHAEDLTIATGSNFVSARMLLEMARELAYERLSFPPESIAIEHNNLPPDFHVRSGALTITPEPPAHEDFIGLTFVPFAIAVDGELVRRVSLNITVRVRTLVAVAARSIGRGETVSAADFRLVERDLATQPTGAVLKAENAIGKISKVTIGQDQVLCERMLSDPPLVRQQQRITVRVVCGNVVLRVPGVALQDGLLGQDIRVVSNLSGNRAISATVVEEGVVLLTIPGGASL